MLNVYLRKAPTLTVIAVTGFVAWPIFFDARNGGPPKQSTKPSVTAQPSNSLGSLSMRNPFQMDRTSNSNPNSNSNSNSNSGVSPVAGTPAGSTSEPGRENLPAMVQEEDKVLAGMKLVGTFIDGREKLAVIDNKIYTRGDQLRGADGSLLPYVVTEILKDRALVRRGRRDFVISFSNTLRTGVPRVIAPLAVAKVETAVGNGPGAKVKGPGTKGQPLTPTGDQKQMLLQLLSGLGGVPGSGTAGGLNQGALPAGVNSSSISAGLDALTGKYDTIGRGNDASILPSLNGGTTP